MIEKRSKWRRIPRWRQFSTWDWRRWIRAVLFGMPLFFALACVSMQAESPPGAAPAEASGRSALNLSPNPAPGSPARLIFIAVAGMQPADYLDGAAGPVLPTVALLGERGVMAEDVMPVFPAAMAPALASLLSGQRPDHHGIVADRLLGKHGVRTQGYSHASELRGMPLWFIAEDAGQKVAVLGWPTMLGASVSTLFPDLAPSEADARDWDVVRSASTPWLVTLAEASVENADQALRPGPVRDQLMAQMSCALLESSAPPSLLLVRFSQSEPALRRAGPHSEDLRRALLRIDAEIGNILGCLQRSGALADSAIAVVGDIGWTSLHTRIHPNRLLRDAGLIQSEPKGGEIQSWEAIARSNGGSAFVYATGDEQALEARRVLQEAGERSHAFRVISAAEMLANGADPMASFGLEAELGYGFGDSAQAAFLAAAQDRAVGGYLPDEESAHPGFVLYGRGVRSGVEIPRMRQVDIAPTLAFMLGLSLEESDGVPLVGALRLGP